VAILVPATASADVTSPDQCNVVAAPTGSDTAAGTVDRPLRSAQALAGKLGDGQIGCFRAGTYDFDEMQIDAPGAIVTSFPGETATLRGQLRIEREATGATVENLTLDGINDVDGFSPLIYADDAVVRNNDISNERTTNCVHVAEYYDHVPPDGVVIENNSIHDCGGHDPNHDHGIYIASSTNLTIRNNEIYDNADRGIQLWPDAQYTRVTGNVIDGNGQGIAFGGYNGKATSHTVVENNIITNSNVRWNVEYYWDDEVGVDNVVRNNCIYGAKGWYGDNGSGISDEIGFKANNNVTQAPQYANPASGDFTLTASSPCAGILEGAGPVSSTTTPSTAQPISLDTTKPRVPEGTITTLHGTVPSGVGQVAIKIKRHGKWRRAGSGHVRGNKFRAKVIVPETTSFKATATGARDSKPLKVAAIDRKRKNK
jgi:parallel beta-helix repeat protein